MNSFTVSEFLTLITGLSALVFGDFICNKIELLRKLSIPPAVIGGLIISVIVLCIESYMHIKIDFASQIRDVMILIFFVSLGFSAKLIVLRKGGKPLLILCLVTVLLLFLQNIIGIGVALVNGSHPFYGLLAGSVSFVGGPGTAMAWAKEATAFGLKNAELVAISSATFAVAVGALVSGPIVTRIVNKHHLKNDILSNENISFGKMEEKNKLAASTTAILKTFLIVSVAVFLGNQLNVFASSRNFMLPGFLCSILAGMFITNLADAGKWVVPTQLIDRLGDIALQIFLVISMMSLKLSSIGLILGPLVIVVVLQVALAAAVAYFILFRYLGKNYDAAVAVGGFLGYAISSMPIAMATMEQITKRFGPAQNAILIITLAGSFFVDLANAFIVKIFMSLLPMFS